MLRLLFVPLLAFFIVLTPDSATAAGCNKGGSAVGAAVGGILGGLLGNKVNRGAGTVIGALAGGLLGSVIASKLDKCEQQRLSDVTSQAANDPPSSTPIPRKWTSDTREGVEGTVVAGPVETVAGGKECRVVTQVAYVDGQEVRDSPKLCRVPPQTNWTKAA